MMSVTGRPEIRHLCGASINDNATGMFTVIGALGRCGGGIHRQGLHRRYLAVRDRGAWVEGQVNNHVATCEVRSGHGTGGPVIVPYQLFDCADRPNCLAPARPLRARARRCSAIRLATDERYARRAAGGCATRPRCCR